MKLWITAGPEESPSATQLPVYQFASEDEGNLVCLKESHNQTTPQKKNTLGPEVLFAVRHISI